MTFTIVRVPSIYNAILGRSGLNALRAIVSIYHLLVRLPTKNGAEKICGDQQLARRCFQISTQNNKSKDFLSVDKLDQRKEEEQGEPANFHPDGKESWTDGLGRIAVVRPRATVADRAIEGQRWYIRLVGSGYVRHPSENNDSPTQHHPWYEAGETKETIFHPRKTEGHRWGSRQTTRDGLHQRNHISRLARQCRHGEKSQREVEDLYRLHRPESSLPKG